MEEIVFVVVGFILGLLSGLLCRNQRTSGTEVAAKLRDGISDITAMSARSTITRTINRRTADRLGQVADEVNRCREAIKEIQSDRYSENDVY